MTTKHNENPFRTTFHRDGTVTVWDVYRQSWTRTDAPSDSVMASLDDKTRVRIARHCGITDIVGAARA